MNAYENMTSLDIAKDRSPELNRRTPLQYIADKIPIMGFHLKSNRLANRRQEIMSSLTKELDSEKFDMVNRLLVYYNDNQLSDAKLYHSIFKWTCGVGGLIGTGVAIGSYLN